MRKGTILGAALAAALAVPGAVSAQYANPAKAATSNTIVDVAVEAGMFETLVTAVKAAGLVEVLSGEGPFTVFAPTDEAFAKLPKGTLETLLANPDQLKAILTYHVVPGKIPSSAVVKAGSATPKTVNGDMLNVRVKYGKVMVDNATVIKADVPASNGVIHVIDTVVLPDGK